MELSIVASIYNDEKIVSHLTREIISHVDPLKISYEIILVNDNSKDNSDLAIMEECRKNKNIKGITLSRNYGQQITISAGMRYASGKYVVIMDGDLQNPPSEIPRLYRKIQEGYDIIYTTSKTRNNFVDEMTSRIFWFLLANIFKVNIVKKQLMMKIMRSEFVQHFNQYSEISRIVAGITTDIGMKYALMEVSNERRRIGKSNYNFFKRFYLMLDMLMNLTAAPLNLLINASLITLLFTITASCYYLFAYLFFDVPPGYTSIVLSIFFFGSAIIFILGIIGKYLSTIHMETKNRPLFFIKNKFNL